ncbi:hypothetical protein ACFFK0_24020 [Paenibacillus chartarius]|uniref:Uncharacterized protein n=1 Tax=Paenibacillus chartarius TaxID=747481 RepID=A0ABV6DS56_9BACL
MNDAPRRPLARLSVFGIIQLHPRNPLMVAWWSAVFPGFGHYLLQKFSRGTLLTLSEVIINTLAHINEAMVLSFCGRFEEAKSILEPNWMFGYLAVYLLSIGDCYRSTLTMNKLYDLADREQSRLPSVHLYGSEVQYVEQKNPVTAMIYSTLFPGMGQLYNHRIFLAFYAMFWWWFYASNSRAYEALLYLVLGNLSYSTTLLNPHWLLFMPSVMGGAVYHAFVRAVEHNKLFRDEQRQFLTDRYRYSKVCIGNGIEARL